MELTIEKQVHLSESSARRLEEIAAAQGTSEDAIIQKALEKLFHEDLPQSLREKELEMLRQLEAEIGPVERKTRPPINPADIIAVEFPVYIDPARINYEELGR